MESTREPDPQYRRELRETVETLRAVLEAAPLAVVATDLELRVTMWNPAAERLLGWSADEVVGEPLRCLPPEEVDAFCALAARVLAGEVVTNVEATRMRRDGSRFDANVSLAPLCIGNGVEGVIAIVADVSERRRAERALRENERRLELALRSGSMVAWEHDLATDGITWTGGDLASLVWIDLEQAPRTFSEFLALVHPADRGDVARPVAERIAAGVEELEYRLVRPDGHVRWVASRATVTYEGGAPVRAVGVLVDTTARKEAVDALRGTSEALEALLRAAPVAIVATDLEARTTMWSPGAERMFGWSAAEVLGAVPPIMPAEEAGRFHELRSRALAGEPVVDLETTRLRKDGTALDVSLSLAPVRNGGGRPGGTMGVFVDIGERVRAQRDLERSFELLRRADEERRRLLAELVGAQEEERRRLAADIHDDAVQAMTAAGLRLSLLRPRVAGEADTELLGRLERDIGGAISRLRRLLSALRPPELDRGGLAAALRASLDEAKADSGLEFELESRLGAEPEPETRMIAYRIVQEALANVRRHARATRVEVALEQVGAGMLVRVSDDGVGFSVEEAYARQRSGHLGLVSMRERAELAGGWLQIESAPGAGTRVEFWLPLGTASADCPPESEPA